jgi:integrase
LALGFACALRHSELVAPQVEDLVKVPDGFRVMIRRSKTAQERLGQEIAIPRGYRLRPVEAIVKRYAEEVGLDAAQIAGHSLRAGFITSAADSGAALLPIADQSRHKGLDVLHGYAALTCSRTTPGRCSFNVFATAPSRRCLAD